MSSFSDKKVYDKEDAFNRFLIGESEYYLGTQRDVERLSNRKFDFSASIITGYNDLFQYISVMTDNEIKYKYAVEFINALISEKNQKRLYSISMFSPYFNVEYDNNVLNNNQIFDDCLTISPFCTKDEISIIKSLSNKILSGDNDALSKIKKSLI